MTDEALARQELCRFLARMFHDTRTGWPPAGRVAYFLSSAARVEAIALRRRANRACMDVATPSPAWDAGLFAVNARARHCMKFYGLALSLARLPAAVANSSRSGW